MGSGVTVYRASGFASTCTGLLVVNSSSAFFCVLLMQGLAGLSASCSWLYLLANFLTSYWFV